MLTKKYILLLILMPAFLPGHSQNEWTLKKEKDGICVYNRGDEHSKFDELRVDVVLNARLSDLAALLLDIEDYRQWSFNTKSTQVLRQVSPSELFFYSQINSPWPASDRDLVLHMAITQDQDARTMIVRTESVSGIVPVKAGMVRVPLSNETWTVTPVDKNRIRVEYLLTIDPGGSVPPWLINTFSVKGPYETFKNLKERLRLPKYRNTTLAFISN